MSTHTLYCPGVSCQAKPHFPLLSTVVDTLNLQERFPHIYFTPKQVECLQWIAKGYTNRMIGVEMNLSVRTIESHLAIIKCKLNCYSKHHLLKMLNRVD